MTTAGRMLTLSGLVLFAVHAALYVTRGTVYFFPLIIPVEALLRAVPGGDAVLEWLLFPKSMEGINKIIFIILNHMPIWVIVLFPGIILWVTGRLMGRRS